jgi:hypothetical protein
MAAVVVQLQRGEQRVHSESRRPHATLACAAGPSSSCTPPPGRARRRSPTRSAPIPPPSSKGEAVPSRLGPARDSHDPFAAQIGRPCCQPNPPSESRISLRPRTAGRPYELVEAVGIEPTSGNPRRQASTSIADYLLLSLLGPPIGGISERPAPKVSSRTPEQGLGPVTRI